MVIELAGVQFGLKSYAWFRNRTSMQREYDFGPKLHSTQFNYHFIKSTLKLHNFMVLNFRFWCIVLSWAGSLKIAEPETLWHLILYAKWCHVTKTHSSITNKQTVLKWERKQSFSSTKVRFSSPELLMEDLPFFCGWGWDYSLSLEKEFEGAAGVILGYGFLLSCETPSTAWCPAVDSFILQILFNGTVHDFKGLQLVSISVSFCDLGVVLYTQDLVRFLRHRLFQMSNGKWRSDGVKSSHHYNLENNKYFPN